MELDGTRLIDSSGLMDKGFLTEQQRTVMKAILKRGSTQQRFARRITDNFRVIEASDFRVLA